MTATIHRLAHRAPPPSTLARHLTGHHAQGPVPGGALGRMQSVSAARAYVRWISKRHPMSDSKGREDVWQQVEDMVALVPNLASGVQELDEMAHALRAVLSMRSGRRLAICRIALDACDMDVAALGGSARLRLHGRGSTRIITVRLAAAGAVRIDDATVRS